jgi:hypothetical protein
MRATSSNWPAAPWAWALGGAAIGLVAAAVVFAPATVNFVNADIEAVTRAFAAMIERQIAVDPRVKGTITVYSEQPQSVQPRPSRTTCRRCAAWASRWSRTAGC